MSIARFSLFLTLAAALLFLLGVGIVNWWLPQLSLQAVGIAILISYLSGLAAYALAYTGLEKKTTGFLAFLMSGMFLRMLVGLVAIIIVSLKFRPVLIEFVVSFFVTYFIFTAFEVYSLMRKLRPNF